MNIDGTLTEEEQVIHGNFKRYLETRVGPLHAEWEKNGKFPREMMKGFSEIALPATIPAQFGGAGMDEVSIGLMSELMGMHEFPIPAFLTLHFAKLLPLVSDEGIRQDYLKKYLAGEIVICGAFTEPGHGSDPASIETRAETTGNGYAITGEKSFVSSPLLADIHLVTARTGVGGNGISLFLVDSSEGGIEPYEMESMARVFKGDFGGIRFNNVNVPQGNLMGDEGSGFKTLMKTLNAQRVHVALYSIGLALSSLSDAVEYARVRKTFGKPISSHQAVAFRLAEDWTRLESVRLLAYKALTMQDKGIENSAECAAVKWHGCEVAFDAISHALQTFGASGYVKTSPIERRFREARGFLIGDGTPDIQKLIISRKLFGRDSAP